MKKKKKEEVYTQTTIIVTVANPDGGQYRYSTRISGDRDDAFKQIQRWETAGMVLMHQLNDEDLYLPSHRVLHYRIPK